MLIYVYVYGGIALRVLLVCVMPCILCVYSLRAIESTCFHFTRVLLLGWYNYKSCVLLCDCERFYLSVLFLGLDVVH